MLRLSSSIAHSAPMPYSESQSLIQPQSQCPNGLEYSQIQYYQPPVHYQHPATYYEPQQFYQQVEGHYPQMDMPSAWTQPQYYQPPQQYPPQAQFPSAWTQPQYCQLPQQYPPQAQFPSAWTSYPQQQQSQQQQSQPAPTFQYRPIRPKPPTPQNPYLLLPSMTNKTRLPLPRPDLIQNGEPKLDVLLQPHTKCRGPKRPQRVRHIAHPSATLLPLGPQALQSAPNAVQLGLLPPAGTRDPSIAAIATNPIQSRPYAQVSQLALPISAAQSEVPVPCYPAFALPRLTLPSQPPRVNHHEYLSQPTATLSYGYPSPKLQGSTDLPHLNRPLLQASPKELSAAEARSILNVRDRATPSDIRAAYWSLEFELHPDRHRYHLAGVQYVKAKKLAKAQEAADKLRGFIGTCWELERDFEMFRRMSNDAEG